MPCAREIGAGLAGWLRANQDASGRVRDPVHGEYGEYADGCAALALGLMALQSGEPSWIEPYRRALKIATQRPPYSEFDWLALLLLAAAVADHPEGARHLSRELPQAHRIQPYRGRRVVSHNWVAMRAATYSLRARLTDSPKDRKEAENLWRQVLRWQDSAGWFSDAPGGIATPITYHAKFSAMVAVAVDEGSDCNPALAPALLRGLDWMLPLVSPAGVLAPYGRSRHSLFGYAAAILAFRRGAARFSRPEFAAAAEHLVQRVGEFQRPDGHIPCVLNGGEAERLDWDVYVNNPDYNAYAAALFLLGPG
ncbi:MAG: hypothetical protein FJX77_13540 [Armatimonadetes bacterium]|nr:hypothetical protein [Armatimonadota bacterium]